VDPVNDPQVRRRGLLFYVGSAGLLCVMVVEAAAVLGRHVGMPVMGALEIVQVAIVPAACAGMLIATLRNAHAAVHLLTDRLPTAAGRWLERSGGVLAGVFFAAMCGGGAWLAAEYWNTYEQSEVLHIPFRPLRLLVALTGAALAVLSVRRAFRSGRGA
jgi:TRAP-type C4-dicarboxylate transport system permease small subunit